MSIIVETRCCYCLEVKIFHRQKEISEFSCEHVISKSFGKFGYQTMTLNKEVCKVCNQYFGDKLELNLGRDSAFGVVHRGRTGLLDIKKLIQEKRHLQKLSESYAEVALRTEFDVIRNFIRYGIYPNYNIFIASQERLHYRLLIAVKDSVGHIVSIHSNLDGSIKARVSFFNLEFFEILLAKEYKDYIEQRGSFFDVKNKKIFTHSLPHLANDYVISSFNFKCVSGLL